MTYKTTVVTMFFNLKGLKDASAQTRPPSFYIENGRPTLKLRFPMVIFCDEETVGFLKKVRQEEVGDEVPTEYLIKRVQDYDFYERTWGIIQENRAASAYYSSNPNDRNTPSYLLLMMIKPTALRYAHEKNFFNTSHYAWVDLGSSHVVRKHLELCPKVLAEPGPRVKACYIHYRSKEELADMQHFLGSGGPCAMACTIYTVEGAYVNRFYTAMFSIFYEMLLKGVGHNDEQVMTYCYDRYPELFTIYCGDYYSILTNYFATHEDLHTVRWFFIEKALRARRHDLAADAAKGVLRATEEGLQLTSEVLENYRAIAGFK